MNQLLNHNAKLRELIEEDSVKKVVDHMVDLDSIDLILRECLSIEEMREAGSFFTGQSLASLAVKQLPKAVTFDSIVLDPTCGAGNLLIECSRRLGTELTLSQTLEKWGKVLWGFDIYESFVESTKLRLIAEALSRGVTKDCTLEFALSLFKNIKVKDVWTTDKNDLKGVTHAIMNPPFTMIQTSAKYYWNAGKINAAGLVFDHILRILPQDACFSAILPDVLRSGTRYRKFRDFCTLNCDASTLIWGKFNAKTDVDVFLFFGEKVEENEKTIDWYRINSENSTLSNSCDIRIGPLVAYRDPKIGSEYPFLHSKNTTAWEVITNIEEKRKFSGTVIQPPFIVVKRTSSPNDKYRVVATIINIKELVAVENHLIIIKPKSGLLKDCKKIIKILKSKETNDFLNERIRLRHLTTESLKAIPIESPIM